MFNAAGSIVDTETSQPTTTYNLDVGIFASRNDEKQRSELFAAP
jgi:hypothetical protein